MGMVQIYDSLSDTIDGETVKFNNVSNIFGPDAIPEIMTVPKQAGVKDCGVYALVNLIALCFKIDPAIIHFNRNVMRLHLVQCMESGACIPFPLVEETDQST